MNAICLCLLVPVLLLSRAAAQDVDPATEIRALAARLGAERYAVRREADQRLRELGRATFNRTEELFLELMFEAGDVETRESLEDIVREVARHHYFDRTNRGYIGITLLTETFRDGTGREIPGVRVTTVYPDSAAAKAGLTTNDMIIAVDRMRIEPWMENGDFIRYVQSRNPGDGLELHVARNDGIHHLRLRLGTKPEAVASAVQPVLGRGIVFGQVFSRSHTFGTRPPDEWVEAWIKAHRRRWESRKK